MSNGDPSGDLQTRALQPPPAAGLLARVLFHFRPLSYYKNVGHERLEASKATIAAPVE
jgi:hypothetical protein